MVFEIGTEITSTVGVPIAVEVLCEACNHLFVYRTKVEVEASHTYATPFGIGVEAGRANAESRARELAESTLRKYLEWIKKGDTRPIKDEHACPQCGYLQSWMAKRHKRSLSSIIASGCLLALCLSQTIFTIRIHEQIGTLLCGGASLMLAIVLVWAVRRYTYNANKRWFIRQGKNPRTDTPPARGPVNVYIDWGR